MGTTEARNGAAPGKERVDVRVVGTGFAGLYASHSPRGLGLSVPLVEAGSGLGDTWLLNCYTGACCDVASLDHSMASR